MGIIKIIISFLLIFGCINNDIIALELEHGSIPTSAKETVNTNDALDELIANHYRLEELNKVLEFIYAQSLQMSNNPVALKQSQAEWVKTRPTSGEDLDYNLEQLYSLRIKALLQDEEILRYLANEIIKNPSKYSSLLVAFTSIGLLEYQNITKELFEFPENLRYFEFIKVSPNKVIVFLSQDYGAYRGTYNIYELSKHVQNTIKIKPFKLPSPPDSLFLEKNGSFSLAGNIVVDEEHNNVCYNDRPNSFLAGYSCCWKIQNDTLKVMKRYIGKLEPKLILESWVEEASEPAEYIEGRDVISFSSRKTLEVKQIGIDFWLEGEAIWKGYEQEPIKTRKINGKLTLENALLVVKDGPAACKIMIEPLDGITIYIKESRNSNCSNSQINFDGLYRRKDVY